MKPNALFLTLTLMATGVATVASAETPMPPKADATQAHGASHGGQKSPEDMAGHLDHLKADLHLRNDQMAAWDTYQKQARNMCQDGMKPPAETDAQSTPERMHQRAEMMKAHAEKMEKASQSTAAFYGVLSAEQKTIFDLHHEQMHARHSGHGGGHHEMSRPE